MLCKVIGPDILPLFTATAYRLKMQYLFYFDVQIVGACIRIHYWFPSGNLHWTANTMDYLNMAHHKMASSLCTTLFKKLTRI